MKANSTTARVVITLIWCSTGVGTVGAGASVDYFPLQLGNRWSYARVIDVTEVTTTAGDTYLLGMGGRVLDPLTLAPLAANPYADAPIAALHDTQRVVPASEFTLVVTEALPLGDRTCYRMSTGQLLRNDASGRLLDCGDGTHSEAILFDFPQALQTDMMFSFGALQPFDRGWFGFPYHLRRPRSHTLLGTFADVVAFGHTDGHDTWSIEFARGVGVISCGEGNDVASSASVITSAHVDGKDLDATAVQSTTWGMLKAAADGR